MNFTFIIFGIAIGFLSCLFSHPCKGSNLVYYVVEDSLNNDERKVVGAFPSLPGQYKKLCNAPLDGNGKPATWIGEIDIVKNDPPTIPDRIRDFLGLLTPRYTCSFNQVERNKQIAARAAQEQAERDRRNAVNAARAWLIQNKDNIDSMDDTGIKEVLKKLIEAQ